MNHFRHCETTFFQRNVAFPEKVLVYLSLATTRADSLLRLRSIITPADNVST